MKAGAARVRGPLPSHFHIHPTPLITRERWAARTLRRKLERDALKGKLPDELRGAKFTVVECINPMCIRSPHV